MKYVVLATLALVAIAVLTGYTVTKGTFAPCEVIAERMADERMRSTGAEYTIYSEAVRPRVSRMTARSMKGEGIWSCWASVVLGKPTSAEKRHAQVMEVESIKEGLKRGSESAPLLLKSASVDVLEDLIRDDILLVRDALDVLGTEASPAFREKLMQAAGRSCQLYVPPEYRNFDECRTNRMRTLKIYEARTTPSP
jgi:hypothetical protein